MDERFLRRSVERLQKAAQVIDELSCALQGALEAEAGGPAGVPGGPRFGRRPGARIAQAVRIRVAPGGGPVACIDDQPGLPLTPGLAALLELLCATGEPHSGVVGFKSLAQLQAGLLQASGRVVQAHAVVVLISRLRVRLEAAGLDPQLVETAVGPAGYRFRLCAPATTAAV